MQKRKQRRYSKKKGPPDKPLAGFEERFITPEERVQRIIAAMEAVNIQSLKQLANILRRDPNRFRITIARERMQLRTLLEIAHVLNVSMRYLTER